MRAFLSLCLAFLLSSFAAAQEESFDQLHVRGIAALSAGKYDEGIALFQKCLALRPEDPVSAYNIACGHAQKSEPDAAFEWLGKAADWGFGNLDDQKGVSNLTYCPKDTDLTVLHADPRWPKLMERMAALRAPIDAYRATPATYVPAALEGASAVPLLVVLHDQGRTKDDVVAGRWKQVADELGCALLAPSGRILVKPTDPKAGMAWFLAPAQYAETYRVNEAPVAEAVALFQKTRALVPERVYIAGEGQATMVAFNVAVAKPALYKGVLLVDGVFHGELAKPRVAKAVEAGLRAHVICDKAKLAALAKMPDAQPLLDGMENTLSAWKLPHRIEGYALEPGAADPTAAKAVAALKAFAAPPAPAEAPAPAGGR